MRSLYPIYGQKVDGHDMMELKRRIYYNFVKKLINYKVKERVSRNRATSTMILYIKRGTSKKSKTYFSLVGRPSLTTGFKP